VKILIVGYFTKISKENIIGYFPADWNVVMVSPGSEMLQHIENCHVIIPEHINVDSELLSIAKNLKLVQTGAGFDNIDINACTRFGVWAANAAGINAQAVAEHVMAMMLSYYKNISFLNDFMKNRMDEKQLDYTGSELKDKTIGIIGFGAVGKKLAVFCKAFEMKVLAYSRSGVIPSGSFVKMTNFEDIIQVSDIVSVHTALNQQTKHIIDQAVFKKMKKSALFINTARGGIVNEKDLIEALRNKDISGACLDVFESEPLSFDSELRDFSNVILTPHTAGMPDGFKFHKKRYDFFIDNIKRVENGEEPKNKLNQLP
jgi:phosphoglycerate dehydrogenase-like enzyme